jgi:hypothetical protein
MRDFCLLQNGPAKDFRNHARWYSASVLATATLSCLTLRSLGSARILDLTRSPRTLGIAVICHLVVTIVCLGLARSRNYGAGWVLALVPLPAPWIFLVMTATALYPGGNVSAAAGFIFGVTAAWLAVIGMAMHMQADGVPSDEQDFSVSFAGWSNCMACCLVPLMIQ